MAATVHESAGQGGHQVGHLRDDQGATPTARPTSIHDEDAHGSLQADRTAAGLLASVADLVQYVGRRDTLPLGEAAALVLAELEGAAPGLELFETQAGRFARRVDDAWQCEPPNAEPRSFWNLNVPPEPSTTLHGPSGALQALRLAWVEAPATRAALAQLPCARLAVRLSWAVECFDYGKPAEAAPVLPGSLPPHDVNRWGITRTATARPVDLVRVADAVRAAMQPGGVRSEGLPLQRAAAWVLEGLAPLPPQAWHELDLAGPPRRINDAREWRPAYQSGAEFLQVARRDDEAASWPALPALRGPAGVLQWLRECWVARAASVHDLDAGSAAWLAVPARDVAGLAWLESQPDAPAAAVETLPSADGAGPPRPGTMKAGRPGNAELQREWLALKASGSHEPTKTLAAKYGLSADTIQRATKPVRTAGATGRPAASVFELGTRASARTGRRPAARR